MTEEQKPWATDDEVRAQVDPRDRVFICIHQDPRCEDDPCPWGIARTLCNAPADHPARLSSRAKDQSQ